MTTRNYSSRSQQSTLTSAVTAGATTITVQSGPALLGGATISGGTTFTLVIDPDTALEEIVDATAVSTNTFTITRGIDGSSAQAHSAGAVTRHMAIGRDYREANTHIEASTGVHGISNSSSVVGTIDTQTLTNKTLTSPTITNPSISGAGVDASIVFEGATPDAFETTLTVVDPTQDNTITMPNTTGTVVIATAVQTLTNKTLTSPTISGSPVITGLSSAGMSASSATPKDYVDSILGSATAAATSAASAATSAASAATSAGSSETSAIASATSASASASSATAAATSATSAAASATAAATSATSAANSATTAANSVATIAGYATSAANSATAAATSATSAATSASSALTSANSAATSASTMNASVTAAATSAASAAASATAAATSATSAAASATAANTSAINAAASESVVAASASAAATSATSASNSATAAATSAASASTSASSALTSQTAAATSAASASTSASSALTSATSAATSYDEFDDRYLGAKSSPPSVDNDGNALLTGALYWNTVSNKMFVWSGTAWGEISSSADIIAYKYTVSAGATSVSGPDDNSLTLSYIVGKEQVYINGVLQVRGSDYTASNGTSITGMAALTASDIVTVLAFTAFSVSNTYTQAEANARFVQNTGDFSAGKNKILNGDFSIWQRGTTFSTAGYTADRWKLDFGGTGAAATVTQQTFTPGTAPVSGYESAYFYQVATTSGSDTGSYITFEQRIEDPRTFAGQTITVSFWAKATSGTPKVGLEVIQNSGGSGSAVFGTNSTTRTISTSWARYSFTFVVPALTWTSGQLSSPSGGGHIVLNFWLSNGSTLATRSGNPGLQSNTFQFWGMQAEAGSTVTAFQTATGNPASELAACQRYYVRFGTGGVYEQISFGMASDSTYVISQISLPVAMRVTPSAIDFSTLRVVDTQNASTVSSVTFDSANRTSTSRPVLKFTTSGSLTQYRPYFVEVNNSSSGYLGLSAEL